MAYPLWEEAVTEHLLGLAHLCTVFVDFVLQHVIDFLAVVRVADSHDSSVTLLRRVKPAERIAVYGLNELAHTEFHIVEIRNGLAELHINVSEH